MTSAPPTLAECGFWNMTAASWYSLLASTGPSATVVAALNRAVNEVLGAPDLCDPTAQDGAAATSLTFSRFGDLIDAHTGIWVRTVPTLSLQPDQTRRACRPSAP